MIERFVEQYSQPAFEYAYHLCGNVEDAKELVQEAFVRLMRNWRVYDQTQPLENWFLTILRNVHFDHLKRYERRHAVSLDVAIGPDGSETFADVLEDGSEPFLEKLERQDLVARALSALSPEHRTILILADMQGASYDHMATVLDCPLNTVRSRLNRARGAFKAAMLAQNEVAD